MKDILKKAKNLATSKVTWGVVLAVIIGYLVGARTAEAEERLNFGFSAVQDGSCTKDTLVDYVGEYYYEGHQYDVSAYTKVGPSGGDCTVEATTYNVSIKRFFDLNRWGLEAVATFGADKRATSAPYKDQRQLDLETLGRDRNLAAGAAETITAAIGIRKDFGIVKAGVSYNIQPVDWCGGRYKSGHNMRGQCMDPSKGRTTHFTLGVDYGNFDLDSTFDMGKETFGELAARYHYPFSENLGIQFAIRYAFGLQEIDGGAPAQQYPDGRAEDDMGMVKGTPWFLQDAPEDDRLSYDLTLSFTP